MCSVPSSIVLTGAMSRSACVSPLLVACSSRMLCGSCRELGAPLFPIVAMCVASCGLFGAAPSSVLAAASGWPPTMRARASLGASVWSPLPARHRCLRIKPSVSSAWNRTTRFCPALPPTTSRGARLDDGSASMPSARPVMFTLLTLLTLGVLSAVPPALGTSTRGKRLRRRRHHRRHHRRRRHRRLGCSPWSCSRDLTQIYPRRASSSQGAAPSGGLLRVPWGETPACLLSLFSVTSSK